MATHPLQAIGQAVGATGGDPRPVQLSSLFQGANDGPAKTAAKLTGVQGPGKRADDGPYFTNNEAVPFPDPAHSKTAGGLPLASDAFLFQKQQHFNRSKLLERMVHPCSLPRFPAYIVPVANPHRWKWRVWPLRGHKGCFSPDQGSLLPISVSFILGN